MKACITCSFALLSLCAGGIHAQQASRLQVGTPVRATLAAGDTLRYELDLPKSRFVAGRVDQDGVDATVTVTGPAGSRVLRAARVGRGGPETFAFATDTAGRYMIEVAPAVAGKSGALRVQLTHSEPVATTPEGKVDQAAAQLYKDTPGAVVGVIKGGKLAFVKGYGAADLTYGMPFTAETPTNIGSSTKQFTGFALTLLASRGKLSLDDDVRKHIPELKDFGKKITLRNLVTHTTGYREFINTLIIEGRQVLEGDYIAPDEVIKVINRQPTLQNEPGAEFNYNNSAFSLATIVVERVTGRPFAEWMREEVFLPLGMTKTWVRANPGQIIPGRSVGYIPGEGGFREVRDLHGSAGAGGIYTTPGDAAKWLRNLKTGELGGAAVISEMTTSFVLNSGSPSNYGYGLFLDTNRGLKRWQHGGNDIAHSSTFVYYPDLDAGYVVFSNYQGVPGGIAGVVANAFFDNIKALTASNALALPGSYVTFTGNEDVDGFRKFNFNNSNILVLPETSGWFALDSIDLTGVRSASIMVGWQDPPTVSLEFEARLDAPAGRLLGKGRMPVPKKDQKTAAARIPFGPINDGKFHKVYFLYNPGKSKPETAVGMSAVKFGAR